MIDFCDLNHQPIAFLGTCPICRQRTLYRGAPLHTNKAAFWQDLDKALRAHYLQRAERQQEGLTMRPPVVS